METSNDILNELTSLSPFIAGLKKVNVFTVPQGYFNSISLTVLASLQEADLTLQFTENRNSPSLEIPEGYFDHLSSSILEKIKSAQTASNEIKNLSPLLHAIQNKNVFEVPAGYFEQVDKTINEQIKTVSAKDEIKELSPLLAGIQSQSVFEVPAGYFTGIAAIILKRLPSATAKVISLRQRSRFIRYAVAAMITGVLALWLYKYVDKPVSVVTNESNAVATLDATIEKGKNMNDQQFNAALENLSETDIAKYLEKNGDLTDIATLGNNIETSSLPSMEDYLLDESTLDNYLKKIDIISLNN